MYNIYLTGWLMTPSKRFSSRSLQCSSSWRLPSTVECLSQALYRLYNFSIALYCLSLDCMICYSVEMLIRHCEYLRKKKRTLLLCGGMYARSLGSFHMSSVFLSDPGPRLHIQQLITKYWLALLFPGPRDLS